MKRLHKILSPMIVIGALAAAPALGCQARAAYVVETTPPAPRAERVVYRPGHVWVQGYWVRSGSGWRWNDGHYARERPHEVYVQPRWERRGRHHVFVNGGWRARGRVVVR